MAARLTATQRGARARRPITRSPLGRGSTIKHLIMQPIKTLPIVERWECASCGRCCRGSIIRLDEDDLQRLRDQAWDQHPQFLDVKTIIRDGWLSPSYRLAQRSDGSCVFLTSEGRCRIHEVHGADAKPLVCRMFPLQLVAREKSAVLTLRRACPTAAADQGPELQSYQSLARQLAKAGKLIEKTVAAPAIVGRRVRSWDDFLAVGKRLERLLTDNRFPLVRRVVHGLRFVALLEQCKLRKLDSAKLAELCDLLCEGATDVGDLFSERPPPARAAATLFRQTAAEYLRLHPTFTAGNSWRERWRMARTAVGFARGKGAVPRLHPGLPETTFEALERPLGHLDEAVQRPLVRFFETHAVSLQYALTGRPGWTLVENFRALALSFPVGLWLLRLCCTDRSPTVTDTIDIVTIMDRGQGYAALTSSNHRSRIKMLARLDALEQLAVWYAR
jgi:lysine-N-methylase